MSEPSQREFERAAHALTYQLLKRGLPNAWITACGLVYVLRAITAEHAPHGDLGASLDNRRIAELVQWEGSADELVEALTRARLLEQSKRHRLIVHDWPRQATKGVHRMVIRSLSHFANGEPPRVSEGTEGERQRWLLYHAPKCERCKRAKSGDPAGTPRGPHGDPAGSFLRSEEDLREDDPVGTPRGPHGVPGFGTVDCTPPAEADPEPNRQEDEAVTDPDRPLTREEATRAFDRLLASYRGRPTP